MSKQNLDFLTSCLAKLSSLESVKGDPEATDLLEKMTAITSSESSAERIFEYQDANSFPPIDENFLNQIVNNISVGIFCRNSTGHFTYWSNECSNIFGLDTNKVLDQKPEDLFDAAIAGNITKLDRLHYQNKSIECEVQLAGSDRIIKLIKTPYISDTGQFTSITVCRDISERKTQEEQVRSQLELDKQTAVDAAQAKSNFLATMSHEIRTPINGIIGVNNLLLKTALNEEQQYYSRIINQSATSLLEILNDILDIAKIESGKIQVEARIFDLPIFLTETLEILAVQARQKGLNFDCHFLSLPDYIVGDSNLLGQVLRNLVSNAIKFTKKGSISIHAETLERKKNTVKLIFKIKDTGIGIPKDKLQSIFKSFTQASSSTTRLYGGTGLGLSISKELIKKMKGTIQVESTPEIETIFTFTVQLKLPSSSQTACLPTIKKQKEIVPTAPNTLNDRHVKILIVEDNNINQLVLKGLLKKMGKFDITCAENGQIGLNTFEKGDFDIIFMDCQMPVMDGLTATREIRKTDKYLAERTPIVAITANATLAAREECMKAGMDEYITKPVHESKLQEVFNKFLFSNKKETIQGKQVKEVVPEVPKAIDLDFDSTNLNSLEDPELIDQVLDAYL
ncbi:MAG: response regulator, partial [Lentisphaeraceae bacterium]|nr:response regulator [Lentisphaeraceae bacterium]